MEIRECLDRWCRTFTAKEVEWRLTRLRWEREWERVRAGGGVPMDLDALRYMGTVTSPFHGNVQFDRHPTEGGEWFFGVEGV